MHPQPGENIEVKARYADLDKARAVCQRIGAAFQGVLNQIDTYLRADTGRLKLRQISTGGGVAPTETTATRAELIEYHRANEASARASHYRITAISDPIACLEQFERTHPRICTVRKRRELYLWHNVRIHLDQVEGLGSFIEFEGVVADADEALSRQRVDRLVGEFGIEPSDQIGVSYSDLLIAMEKRERTPEK